MEYRQLKEEDINRKLFVGFQRRQVVTDCWRNVQGRWCIQSDPFIDQWDEADYRQMILWLRHTVCSGGVVYAALEQGCLKGFASVEGTFFGCGYLDLSHLHVSQESRRKGIGRTLFFLCARWAKEKGAKKLYLSTHSAVETQAFYRALGCVWAKEPDPRHIEKEPYDCQLEYELDQM